MLCREHNASESLWNATSISLFSSHSHKSDWRFHRSHGDAAMLQTC